MAFPNGSNSAYDQMVQVEPGIWLIPGVAYHYLKAKQRYNSERGSSFRSTEGFRPLGHRGDYAAGNSNTQWYYWERKIAKPSSPSGAYPGGSMHGWGRAVDVNLNDDINYSRMRAFMEDEGFVFDIDDERWHANYYGSDMWTAYDLSALGDITPLDNDTPKDWLDMVDEATLDRKLREIALWAPYAANPHAAKAPDGTDGSFISQIGNAITAAELQIEWNIRNETMTALHNIGMQLGGQSQAAADALAQFEKDTQKRLDEIKAILGDGGNPVAPIPAVALAGGAGA